MQIPPLNLQTLALLSLPYSKSINQEHQQPMKYILAKQCKIQKDYLSSTKMMPINGLGKSLHAKASLHLSFVENDVNDPTSKKVFIALVHFKISMRLIKKLAHLDTKD